MRDEKAGLRAEKRREEKEKGERKKFKYGDEKPGCCAGFAPCATPIAGNAQIFPGGLRYAL
jgi:hypothetical protein